MSTSPNVAPEARSAWRALGVVGIVFLVVGLTDLLLAWIPPRFGDADWEFATVSATFNNFPVPAIGLGLTLAAALATRAQLVLRLTAAIALLLTIWSLVAAVLFALTVPIALGAAEGVARRVVLTSSIKTGIQVLAYTILFVWSVRRSWSSQR